MSRVVDVYNSSRAVGASTAYRTGISGADAVTVGTVITSGSLIRRCKSPTLTASCRFSGAAADTVVIWPVFYVSTDAEGDADTTGTYTFVGEGDRRTVTAGASTDANSDNVGPNEVWDTYGATHYEIRAEAPSAGTVDLHVWEY